MASLRERLSGVVGAATKRHESQSVRRRLAHVAPTTRKFRSKGQAARFKHREKATEQPLGPTSRAHRRFRLYGESKSPFKMLLRLLEDDKLDLDPKEVRKAERKKYQDDIRRGRIDLPQRIARVWSRAKKKGKTKLSSRLSSAYRRLTGG